MPRHDYSSEIGLWEQTVEQLLEEGEDLNFKIKGIDFTVHPKGKKHGVLFINDNFKNLEDVDPIERAYGTIQRLIYLMIEHLERRFNLSQKICAEHIDDALREYY